MKTKYLIFSLATLFVLYSCAKDEEVAITTVQINNLSIAPLYTRSAFACDLVANSPIADVELQYSTDPSFGEGLYQTLQMDQNEHHYTANLEPLQQGQTYYVRYKVFNTFNYMFPERVDTFCTRAYTLPFVRTDSVTHITTHSADCYFTLTDWGCDSLPAVGICCSTTASDYINLPYTTLLSDSTFVCSLSDLTDGKTYTVYAYAKNAQGTAYSEHKIKFTTISIVPPTVATSDVTAISYTSAVCGGDITSDGNAEVTARGICYADTAQPTTKDSVIVCGSGIGSFSTVLPNLQDGTTYYVRAFATNSKGTAYGEQKTFTTSAYSLPTLTTADATNVSYTTATCGGDITSAGGQTITACGICYSTKSNPTIADSKVASDSRRTSFNCNLTGLADATTYYVRAYATNGKGTAYGEQKTFTTTSYYAPTVSTNTPQNISFTTTTCGGKVLTNGALSITDKGICYSTSPSPTINSQKISCGTGSEDFTCTLSNLRDSTVYYARAYAVNAKGVAYGEQVSWRTKGYALPMISTTDVTSISYTSATCGGNVTSDGGQTITERGICYSTKTNPTISNSKVVNSSGKVSFTCNLTNLADATTYYVRAFATNSKGTAYGEQKTFTTSAYSLPTLTTAEVTNISYTTATCGGNITSDGGLTVTARGVCYSTQPNPTITDSKVAGGSGMGTFKCNLTKLMAATTYYVRSYAINSKGIVYGGQKVFTTDFSVPTVSTLQVSDISFTSAVCSGNVVSTGGLNITSCGICYSTNSNPTIADNIISANSSSIGVFSCKLINLSDGVTYYIRAYAINSKGVAYGEISSFNTVQQPYFSVGENKFVVFAPGNLQYRASTDTYRFAENQFDRIGYANENISDNYDGWIDLFGWGTGNMPTDTVHEDDYKYKTFVDWGKNSIGVYSPNTWYTPSYDEFCYVLYKRNNAENLFGFAKINGVNGVILLPDDWEGTNQISFSPYYTTYSTWNDNVYDLSEWHTLENTGAIFLPAAGSRLGADVRNLNIWGIYNLSDPWQGRTVKVFRFVVPVQEPLFYGALYKREVGRSVRLVREVVK